jgi:hypothetical protein
MVPVGVIEIAPKVAQNIVDNMDITITNLTFLLPDAAVNSTAGFCSMTLHNSAAIGATMHVTEIVASANKTQGGKFFDFGKFEMPETSIHHGNNEVSFPTTLTITDLTTLLYVAFPPSGLRIVGKPKVSSFGLPLHVTLDKYFICGALTAPASENNGFTPVSIQCLQRDVNSSGDVSSPTNHKVQLI